MLAGVLNISQRDAYKNKQSEIIETPYKLEESMPNEHYYREKLLQEIKSVPQEMTPILYKIVHLLNTQWSTNSESRRKKRGSLRGIWKGSMIDESLFTEARKSLFRYEDR